MKGVNGFIYRLRTRGESENATKRCEVHERKQTHPGTTTVETWTLAPHNAAARNCRNAFGMESLSWNPRIVVPKAPDPRQRNKNGHFWFVAAEGPSPEEEQKGGRREAEIEEQIGVLLVRHAN